MIQDIAIFSDISAENKEVLEKHAHAKKVAKGEGIYFQGDEAETVYYLQEGTVKLVRETLDGEEAVVNIVKKQNWLGEDVFLEENAYNSDAIATQGCVLISFPAVVIKTFLMDNPKVMMAFLQVVTKAKQKQDKEIEHRSVQNAPQRVGCFLLGMCNGLETGRKVLNLPYDKMLIASRLGMKPETFSRALAKLRKELGLVVQGSTVEILSVKSLSEYCCSACSSTYPCPDKD